MDGNANARRSAAYMGIEDRLADDRPVILDGGVATQLQQVKGGYHPTEESGWGADALLRDPERVLAVHGEYLAAGCHVITTATWGILTPIASTAADGRAPRRHKDWLAAAAEGIHLGRRSIAEAGRDDCALAFAIAGDLDGPDSEMTVDLLNRVFKVYPPDLILVETMTLIRDTTFATVEALLATGLPLWLSFRHCPMGVCDVHGTHWAGPEGDTFGVAAHRFEKMGVGALLINCIPPNHVSGMVGWLRGFTAMPLGVYPNLGRQTSEGWHFEEQIGSADYASLAVGWRAEGAQIVGGCCGVTPEYIAATRLALADLPAGRQEPFKARALPAGITPLVAPAAPKPWTLDDGRAVFPLPVPSLKVDPGVFPPTLGSLFMWKAIWERLIGKGKRCADIGCGCGILAVQMALNGATGVHAIDLLPEAVANTGSNAHRHGVDEVVTGEAVDLYDWVPRKTFEIVVASLYQMPVDPFATATGHRPADYWGRNMVDHLIRLLPTLLSDDGVAYILHLSILGQERTASLAESLGLTHCAIDHCLFPFTGVFEENEAQIAKVEKGSDAYHLRLGDPELMVAYLVEMRRASTPTSTRSVHARRRVVGSRRARRP